MNEDVFLENLPRTANQILNVLWDKNTMMTAEELTQEVNSKYETQWERRDIQEFINILITADYVDAKRKGFRKYYHALGMEYMEE